MYERTSLAQRYNKLFASVVVPRPRRQPLSLPGLAENFSCGPLRQANGPRVVTLATATPVANSMAVVADRIASVHRSSARLSYVDEGGETSSSPRRAPTRVL